MKKFTPLFFLLMICFFPSKMYANELGNWKMYFGNQKLNDRFNFHHELQYRDYNFIGDLNQLLLRFGVGYNLTADGKINALVGYGFIHSEVYDADGIDKTGNNEHRIFEQIITKQQFGRVYMNHRYRFEQRFLEDDFRMRLRYHLSFNIPINHPTMTDNTWYLSAYNELFMNTERNLFDRNRLFGAIGYQFNKKVKVELGIMNQYASKTNNLTQLQMGVFGTNLFSK